MVENHKSKSPPVRYGLDNPHPLSQLKTELVWDGKYDEYGNRRAVDIAGCAMPLQKIETIDEPRSRAAADGNLELFEKEKKRRDDFRNRLIWGDNKLVMASLLAEFKGKIDLIYIDPPFDVGADFTMDVPIGDEKEMVEKDQSTLEMVAYRDMWGKGTDSYLHMMFERLTLMKDLLSEKGNIYVHCDWHMSAQLRILLNDVFGTGNFLNEIVWYYYNKLHDSRKKILPRAHDVILRYAKVQGSQVHNAPKEKRDEPVKKLKYRKVDGQIQNIIGPDGKAVTYISEDRTIDDVWRIRCLQPANIEETLGYNTQKPEDFVERIVRMGSDEGDLVADFFCGSGTTGAVAERLGRRWIMSDLGRFAIHTSRKRLIELQRTLHDEGKPYRAFDVHNLGRYERQWWQKERLKGADEEHRKVVLGFYKAEVLPNAGAYLHGRKGRAFIYVDGIDSILTRDEVRAVAKAAREAGAKEVHCMAWEFEMDLRLVCHELEASEGVLIKLIPIPREIMEKNRTSPPPFLEVAVLEAEVIYRKVKGATQVDIKLTKFLPSLAEVPSKELEALKERAVKSGFDFIDFWAVDFNWHDGKPFEHHWQDYRTRKDRSLKTVSDAGFDKYPKPGKYTACVKVVDVFGCDTSITVEVGV
jgi:adenine-specific DNA-methyltransferase